MSLQATGPFPSLTIENVVDGRSIDFDVCNNGEASASNVTIMVEISDGYFMKDRLYQDFFSSVSIDETVKVHLNVFGLGLGWYDQLPLIEIKVKADDINMVEKEINARIFGPFVTFINN
jgi:hypothetical protein